MIGRAALQERVREWGLIERVVEKDYVLGWLLWGIGTDPVLGGTWVFKGGTCLKKCYLETYRFSEDLDFTVLPDGPLLPEAVAPRIHSVLARIATESGIDVTDREPVFRVRGAGSSVEGRIYYRGPSQTREVQSIKLDLTGNERVVRPSVLRPVAHPYPDTLPAPGQVRSYAFDELFAEKIRAMGERCRPRDLYDIVNLYWRSDLRAYPALIRAALVEKCATKGVAVPNYAALSASPFRAELESEWENMLGHQLPALPPFEQFWDELKLLFAWLDGDLPAEVLPSIDPADEEGEAWAPPPTIWTWGTGVPFETIRFAAANHLCVELDYQGSVRLIEPYSLRRTREGALLLHALRAGTGENRSYRVDRIAGARVSQQPFRPRYAVEFAQSGPLFAPPTPHAAATGGEPVYIVACPRCGKQFRRKRRDLALRAHTSPDGRPCGSRRGSLVDMR